ncbi:DUF6576 domain-containing protein [Chitinophaga pollutisoli]|uniref:DUF6576 domain-containing protein n=1 Tax=Chitinophaga pollutisoli TaxID=3133966 RepID=UPI0038578E6F
MARRRRANPQPHIHPRRQRRRHPRPPGRRPFRIRLRPHSQILRHRPLRTAHAAVRRHQPPLQPPENQHPHLQTQKSPLRVVRNAPDPSHASRLDQLLDKISEKGYNSLTSEEKQWLRQYSNEK